MSISRPRTAAAAVFAGLVAAAGCAERGAGAQAEARAFLDGFTERYVKAYYTSAQASWDASTDVTPGHDAERVRTGKELARVKGDPVAIETAQRLLATRESLSPATVRELEALLLNAAEAPGSIPDVVDRLVEAESRQSSTLDGWIFCLERDGERCVRPTTANAIDNTLATSRSLDERLEVWGASKEIGAALRPGLVELRELRNRVAREMGYRSFYELQVADYGMSVDEMHAMLEGWIDDTRPLYEQLHCWAKHELAERYGQPVPQRIPAHWLDNRWAQSWDGLVSGVDLDPLFEGRSAEWVVRQAEQFYVSMGFPQLPPVFWERSDLYPVDPDVRRKNSHASAWHLDLDHDVRSLMSVEPNARWFATTHHELGHIYYYLAYSRPEVPRLLRGGANRGFHEGIGDLIGIAALQVPYLRELGLVAPDARIDGQAWLMNEALTESIVFLPWSAGVMSFFERDLYEENLPPEEWNSRWWSYVARFQGVDPPQPRDEASCDACTKTHINDDPAQYYDYAFASVLKYQLHDHIARQILRGDPRAVNYAGSREVGDFLRGILEKGRTEDWRRLLREATGGEISARPMLEYYAPLLDELERRNEGRDCRF